MFDIAKFRACASRRKGDRRGPEQSRIPGEQILFSTDAFFEAEWCAKLGPNSDHQILKGLGVSNPPLSAIQSGMFPYILEK